MINEMKMISEALDNNGLNEGDIMHFSPFLGRRRSSKLLHTKIDFLTQDNVVDDLLGPFKVLDSIQKESLHYRLRIVETMSYKGLQRRALMESLNGVAFRLNGVLSLQSFVEKSDYIEMGYNSIKFESSNSVSNDFEIINLEKYRSIIESDLPVLITGETGTGKTRLAKKIHLMSQPDSKFIHLNLASLSPNLIESELFGHVKGAFTGAINDKKGALADAMNGTLFLDEIDSLPIDIQTKLLIFLDEYKIKPVGSNFEKIVKCRLIIASGQNLVKLVEVEKMRRDFFFRISSGLNLELEPLRNDKSLIDKLISKWEYEFSVSFAPNLIEFYKTLPWPGNIRQFHSHIKKKVIVTPSKRIGMNEYDEELVVESSNLECLSDISDHFQSLSEYMSTYVKAAYFKLGCNATLTGKKLEISPRSVKRYLESAS